MNNLEILLVIAIMMISISGVIQYRQDKKDKEAMDALKKRLREALEKHDKAI
tara:strand:+ start:382 stop:537 length:156 start_codon:yes stop_codon:yes gene_type:complete